MTRWFHVFLLTIAWCCAGSRAGADDKVAPPINGPLTLHVLDTARGKPATLVDVRLERQVDKNWVELGKGKTDDNGRLGDLLPAGKPLDVGVYRLTFETGAYFRARGQKTFFPRVEVTFEVDAPDERYHVPLLVSPFGYSTYRGS